MIKKDEKGSANENTDTKAKPEYRKYLLISVVMLAIVFGVGVKYARFIDGSDNTGLSAKAMADTITVLASPDDKVDGQIAVSLNGAVKAQGYYGAPEGTTLGKLLDYVGVTDEADISTLNSTDVLADGDRIIVPIANELNAEFTFSVGDKLNDSTSSKTENFTKDDDAPDKITKSSGEKININTASSAQLMQLPNIGKKRAADIIDYRKLNGNFSSISSITNVSGIGDKTYAEIKDLISVE